MMNSPYARWSIKPLQLLCICAFAVADASAEEPASFQVHEWSVWIGESNLKQLNAQSQYSSLMPGIVDSSRSRIQKDPKKPLPSPLSVITTYGKPPQVADIDVRLKGGRFLAHWPPAEPKGNRLRWFELKIQEPPADPPSVGFAPDGHWFHQARQLKSLHLGGLKRPERFLTYDAEMELPLIVRLEGGPDVYQVVSLGTSELRDLLLIVPSEQGRRIGWLDQLGTTQPSAPEPKKESQPVAAVAVQPSTGAVPAAAVPIPVDAAVVASPNLQGSATPEANAKSTPARPDVEAKGEIKLSSPMDIKSADYQAQTEGELKKRLLASGLSDREVDLLISLYRTQLFESEEFILLCRLPQSTIDEMVPLVVEPDSTKIVRTALVMIRKADPRLREQIKELIKKLGDPNYLVREEAHKSLVQLGSPAIPSLKEALNDKDVEIATRVERILGQSGSIQQPQ
jgi:hypothetical protein